MIDAVQAAGIDTKKFTKYDTERIKNMMAKASTGDVAGLAEDIAEFTSDKKQDKIRRIAVGVGTIATGALAFRKLAPKVAKHAGKIGDTVAMWIGQSMKSNKKLAAKTSEIAEKLVKGGLIEEEAQDLAAKLAKGNKNTLKTILKEGNKEKLTELLTKGEIKTLKSIKKATKLADGNAVTELFGKKFADIINPKKLTILPPQYREGASQAILAKLEKQGVKDIGGLFGVSATTLAAVPAGAVAAEGSDIVDDQIDAQTDANEAEIMQDIKSTFGGEDGE